MHNINNFPPNVNPQLYNIIAVAVGAALVNDFSVAEQSSIGNWLMLVSQYIITHAAQQNLIESRIYNNNNNKININSKQFKSCGSNYHNNKSNQNVREEIDYLLLAIKNIYKELEKIKNEH